LRAHGISNPPGRGATVGSSAALFEVHRKVERRINLSSVFVRNAAVISRQGDDRM
jgi:hypothetical protein